MSETRSWEQHLQKLGTDIKLNSCWKTGSLNRSWNNGANDWTRSWNTGSNAANRSWNPDCSHLPEDETNKDGGEDWSAGLQALVDSNKEALDEIDKHGWKPMSDALMASTLEVLKARFGLSDETSKNPFALLKALGEPNHVADYQPNKDARLKAAPNDMCKNDFQQVRDSNFGFDFDQYPGATMFTSTYPMMGFERSPELVTELKGFASMAMKQYFGIERDIKKIVKVNAGGTRNFHYYITFTVDINKDGIEETFQAEVVRTIERTIEIPLCRLKV